MPHKHRRTAHPPAPSTSRRDVLKKTAALGTAAAAAGARLSGDRPRAGRHHQDRPPHAAHRLPRPARRIRGCMGAKLAVEEINAAGGMLGRKIELLAEDSVNPADRGRPRRRRMIERDKRRRACWARSARPRASRSPRSARSQQDARSSTPAATPTSCAARLQPLHVPHRRPQHDVRRRRSATALLRERPGQGQEVVHR